MDTKKVLIVAKSFFPMLSPRAFRATELVKELARQGHDVTVYIPKEDSVHLEFEKEHNIVIKDLGKNKFPEITFSGGGVSGTIKRGLKRALGLLLEYPDVQLVGRVSKALKNESGYDLLISIAVPYPIHWGVAASIGKSHKPAKVWVADCGDPYMGDISDSFKKLFYFKYVEKWFFKKTDYISIPIESAKKGYYPEFHKKMVIIPQGFNFDEVDKGSYTPNPVPTFIYAGGFIPGFRDPVPFLKELVTIDKPFKFIIYTKNNTLIKPFISQLGDKLEVRPYINRNELLKILSQADFLVNFNNADVIQSPSKLIDYKLSGRPILNVEYSSVDRKVIDEFFDANYSNAHKIDNIDDYNIKNVAKKFLELTN
ncbi:glycosyltransferase [Flavobacterium sp. MK4S-17]|jgi:hypothetical protein|uniref:glycosyltransferase n=1 Tax=Flavobacterium sp. MK4S-17 TaxID=2543737 RepID=UPI001356F775|nr:glycosyltransferase [Flavobacterium sp. MK4S-17]